MSRGLRQLLWRVIIPILVVLLVSIALMLLGRQDLAQMVSYLGTTLASLGTLLHIVLIDSKKRWPGLPLSIRFSRVITFYH